MTIVVLLILAAIWASVLVQWVRGRAEEKPADSIGDFRHRLSVLQRTAPAVVPAANTLGVGAARRASLTSPLAAPVAGARRAATASAMAVESRRRQARRRRRDILLVLATVAGASLLLGLIPAMRVMLWVHVLADVLLAGYVFLLVQMRNAAAEREMKVRFFPGAEGEVGVIGDLRAVSGEPAFALQRAGR